MFKAKSSLRLTFLFNKAKENNRKITEMAKRIESMKATMTKTSPKMFSLFMMLTTLPSFYFGHLMITSDYNTVQFSSAASTGLAYINIKNLMFFSCIMMLQKLRFNSPTAKHTMPKLSLLGTFIPPVLSLLALALPSSDNKFSVIPTFVADTATLAVEAQAANFGFYPFWLYSYRHYIRFFDLAIIIATYFSLRNLQARVQSHPHQFIQSAPQPATN